MSCHSRPSPARIHLGWQWSDPLLFEVIVCPPVLVGASVAAGWVLAYPISRRAGSR